MKLLALLPLSLPIFADEITPPHGFDGWLADAMYVAVTVAAFVAAIRPFLPSPPLSDQLESLKEWIEEHYASKEHVAGLEKRIDDLEAQMPANHKEVMDSISKLHMRINSLLKQFASLNGYIHGRLKISGKINLEGPDES